MSTNAPPPGAITFVTRTRMRASERQDRIDKLFARRYELEGFAESAEWEKRSRAEREEVARSHAHFGSQIEAQLRKKEELRHDIADITSRPIGPDDGGPGPNNKTGTRLLDEQAEHDARQRAEAQQSLEQRLDDRAKARAAGPPLPEPGKDQDLTRGTLTPEFQRRTEREI